MIEHALELLEFERVRTQTAGYCAGDCGRRTLAAMKILGTAADVEQELERSREAHRILDSGRTPPALDLPDLEESLRVLKKEGTVLEGEALVAIARFCRSAALLKRFLTTDDIAVSIRRIIADMSVPVDLEREIFTLFDLDGNIRYKAVPHLNKIQLAIRKLRSDIEKTAAGFLANPETSGLFQTDVATIKDGRTVLPLKVKFKGRLKGIVHEVSGRGATLFLEPEEIVEKNNELVVQENLFKSELHKLLRGLTGKARLSAPEIAVMLERMSYCDALFARARYAVVLHCVAALPSKNEIILREARHPLLGNGAIPISLSLNEDEQVLLITGPNTGGKTVTLKTLGMLACMNQFGMEIPAAEGTALPVFDNIFADIGDEQSLLQSLSTFQAHMKNIAGIVGHATGRSLVLLDELGAGTDPQEGTAIAMALLDHFVAQKTKVLATTHHGILKNYGFSKKGVVNASVEFDAERLCPTYRLIMGIPGESHALAIARRSGVAGKIIDEAARYLDEERTDIARLIEELTAEKRKLHELGEEEKEKVGEAIEKLRRSELKELALKQRERELREHGIGELSQFLHESRRLLERIIREIREGSSEEAVSEGRSLVARLEERIGLEEKKIEEIERDCAPETEDARTDFGVGENVRIKESGTKGVVVRELKDGSLVVATDNVRVTMRPADLEPAPKAEPGGVEVVYSPGAGAAVPAFELNVRGFRFADMMRSLEKQMDAVLVAGVREFTILHGKGTGILRQGIHDYLARCPYVESFHFALPEHGGAGKTVVHMK